MKNLKNFETFILENDNRTWWGNKFDNDNGVKGYDYSEGEIVTLKHLSWKEKYDFKVIEPGKVPTLKQIDGPREIILSRPQDFILIEPANKIKEPTERESGKMSTEKTPWNKGLKSDRMTQSEFKRLCRETINGHEYDDHSILYDLAEGQVKTNDRLQEYLKKLIFNDHIAGSGAVKNRLRDLIERFVNELEMYAK